jgi:hypothetical protein
LKGNLKLWWLLLPASFGAWYFPTIVGMDSNLVAKELLLLLPLQLAAFGYLYRQSQNKKR